MNTFKLWAVTSYYNPFRYTRRSNNFKRFREELSVPVIVVELTTDGCFEISPDERTIVIRVQTSTLLWHKEALLNYAIKFVPTHVEFVAWLDCDIVFQNKAWASHAIDALERYPLIQLFSDLYDLGPDGDLANNSEPTGRSVAARYSDSNSALSDFLLRPRTGTQVRKTAFGLAWAAKTSLLRRHKLYDAMILGGGDIGLACAAFGRFDDTIDTLQLLPGHAKHYCSWAEPFHSAVKGEVGCIDGGLHHLWHGHVENRNYIKRHEILSKFNFDPARDLEKNADDMWNWVNPNSLLQQTVKRYFISRCESDTAERANSRNF